jgi:hypothetical protein
MFLLQPTNLRKPLWYSPRVSHEVLIPTVGSRFVLLVRGITKFQAKGLTAPIATAVDRMLGAQGHNIIFASEDFKSELPIAKDSLAAASTELPSKKRFR